MLTLSEDKVQSLTEDYGSPLFVVSANTVRENVKNFRSQFSERYPEVVVAYSYKVNYLPDVLRIIHKDGAWAEVASGFEYELAKRLGVPGRSIVFNGPYKKKEELIRAVEDGAIINVDNAEEISVLEGLSCTARKPINVGIRVNTNVETDQLPDRFGFNLESGEAARVVALCADRKLLNVIGLHIHLTSYIVESKCEGDVPSKGIKLMWPKGCQAYEEASRKIARFAREVGEKYGIRFKYLDMGGGFPTVDSLTPYVEAITIPILSEFRRESLPLLILEPGRAIVSNAIDLISTVITVKSVADEGIFAVIDSGINLLPTSIFRYQNVECITDSKGKLKETTVYGPLCLQIDVVTKAQLPELRVGDKVIIKNVGAYNMPQSGTFIFQQPMVVMIDAEEVRIIKKSGTVEDIL